MKMHNKLRLLGITLFFLLPMWLVVPVANAQPPANDDFDNATPITGALYSFALIPTSGGLTPQEELGKNFFFLILISQSQPVSHAQCVMDLKLVIPGLMKQSMPEGQCMRELYPGGLATANHRQLPMPGIARSFI